MNRKWIAGITILLMAGILAFVVMYSGTESNEVYRQQVANFEHTTITMERVTENGEKRDALLLRVVPVEDLEAK